MPGHDRGEVCLDILLEVIIVVPIEFTSRAREAESTVITAQTKAHRSVGMIEITSKILETIMAKML